MKMIEQLKHKGEMMNEADSSFQNWMESHKNEFGGQRVSLQRDMRAAYMAGRESLFGTSTVSSPEYVAWQASKNAKARAALDSLPYAHLIDNGNGTLTLMHPVPYSRPAQPKTCEHCKHWVKPYVHQDHRCDHIKVSDMVETWGRGDSGATFRPPADFGCTLFEVKE